MYADLNIPFNDAYHVVIMRDVGSTEIISFGAHFNRVEGISRIEPSSFSPAPKYRKRGEGAVAG